MYLPPLPSQQSSRQDGKSQVQQGVQTMGEGGCYPAIDLLNFLTDPRVLRQHGDEIASRFNAGESYSAMLVGLGEKFSRFKNARRIFSVQRTGEEWPQEHYEPIKHMVLYAIEQAKKGSDFRLTWKGDA